MEQQVCRLGDDLVVRLRDGGQGDFETFLAHLLRDTPGTLGVQPRRVTSIRPIRDAALDHTFERTDERKALRCGDLVVPETCCRADMTSRPARMRADEKRVAVA